MLCYGQLPNIITVDCSTDLIGKPLFGCSTTGTRTSTGQKRRPPQTWWASGYAPGAVAPTAYDPATHTWVRDWKQMPRDVDLSRLA